LLARAKSAIGFDHQIRVEEIGGPELCLLEPNQPSELTTKSAPPPSRSTPHHMGRRIKTPPLSSLPTDLERRRGKGGGGTSSGGVCGYLAWCGSDQWQLCNQMQKQKLGAPTTGEGRTTCSVAYRSTQSTGQAIMIPEKRKVTGGQR
jgi:hypothetical protein